MRSLAFANRTAKEILRDPLTLSFGLGLPVALLLLLSAIQANIPEDLFRINALAPGMTIMGQSFLTLFSAMLISRDRETAFLQRLYATPMTAGDFLFGYTLPILPIALAQGALCFLAAIPLGLEVNLRILPAILGLLPSALFFIGLGLLCGSVLGSKQAGGICGALLTNLTAIFSNIWFDTGLVGGAFKKIADGLPFSHAVALERMLYSGVQDHLLVHLAWVAGYALVVLAIAVPLFLRQMRRC